MQLRLLASCFNAIMTHLSPNIDLLQNAWALASRHHEGQIYNGPVEGEQFAYLRHIGAVMLEVQQALLLRPDLNHQLALICAILHDTLEDTELTVEEIEAQFGPEVLAGVQALTKNESLANKPAQMQDSLDRILEQPAEIAMVKLADRICNLAPPPHYWNQGKINAYRAEAQLILQRLGGADAYLAKRLEGKIERYPAI